MNNSMRKDCLMRHKNGNCLPTGGFCTAVNDPICEALHNAFRCGGNFAAEQIGRDFGGGGWIKVPKEVE